MEMLQEGEIAYLLDDRGRRFWVLLGKGMVKVNELGVVDGNKLIGAESGSRISLAGKEFWVLRPGILELMESIERGAQIIGSKDAATIVHHLDLKCGDVVIEGGVGSGSLTLSLLNAVGPEGRVISVESREDFAQKARRNVMRSRWADCCELKIGDVRMIGMDIAADAAVLDIPDPWGAVDNVRGMLKGGGRFCAYVPNTNQLESVVNKLRSGGFVEIHALENLQRSMEIHAGGTRPSFDMLGHTGYLAFARKVVTGGEG